MAPSARAKSRIVPSARVPVWLADSCIGSSFLNENCSPAGRLLRRLDAVMDIAGVPFCASDVKGTAASVAYDLVQAQVPDAVRVGSKALVLGAHVTGG